MLPRRRPCLSVAFTFMGRSSPLPTILKLCKDTNNFWIDNASGAYFCRQGVLFRNRTNKSTKCIPAPGTSIAIT